jgi:hypothetical protein
MDQNLEGAREDKRGVSHGIFSSVLNFVSATNTPMI